MERLFCGFIGFVLCVATVFGCNNISYWHKQTSIFSNINFTVDLIGKNKEQAYDEMLNVLDELNSQVNVNVKDVDILQEGDNPSDILRLNLAGKNETVQLGFHAYNLLKAAKEIYTLTEGAFNVAAYSLTYLWGVDALSINYFNGYGMGSFLGAPIPPSFENSSIRPQFKPSKAQIQQVMAYCDLDDLTIWEDSGNYYAEKAISELVVDLGAIAKGYAADLCAQICKDYNLDSALIDVSGNLYVHGKMFNGKWQNDWEIGLREPTAYSSQVLCKFKAKPSTTAVTSGNYERTRFFVNDIEGGDTQLRYAPHVIDTKRGVPYTLDIVENVDGEWDYVNFESHVISATVIGNNSMYADCLSTAACVMGLSKATSFLTSLYNTFGIQALIFASDMRYSNVCGVELAQTDEYDAYKDYQQLVWLG